MRRISFMGQVWAPDGIADADVVKALAFGITDPISIIQIDDRTFDDPNSRAAILSLRDVLDRHTDKFLGRTAQTGQKEGTND